MPALTCVLRCCTQKVEWRPGLGEEEIGKSCSCHAPSYSSLECKDTVQLSRLSFATLGLIQCTFISPGLIAFLFSSHNDLKWQYSPTHAFSFWPFISSHTWDMNNHCCKLLDAMLCSVNLRQLEGYFSSDGLLGTLWKLFSWNIDKMPISLWPSDFFLLKEEN